MNLVCKPSDYYVYSKSFASKYGVRTSILMSYLQDILILKLLILMYLIEIE